MNTEGMRVSRFVRNVYVLNGRDLIKPKGKLLEALKEDTSCFVAVSYHEAKRLNKPNNWHMYYLPPDSPFTIEHVKKVEKVDKPGKYMIETDLNTAKKLHKVPVMVKEGRYDL